MVTYEKVLEIYDFLISQAEYTMARSFLKKDLSYWEGYFKSIQAMYHELQVITDFRPSIRKPSDEEKERYLYGNEKPNLMLEYRNLVVPVYIDDYGQQEYIIYKGKIFTGGPYNFGAYYDFCDYLDDQINKEILDKYFGKKGE